MKIALNEIRIGHASLSDKIYAGVLSKDKRTWLHKIDVTNDFISAVLGRWNGKREILEDENGRKFEIAIRELNK